MIMLWVFGFVVEVWGLGCSFCFKFASGHEFVRIVGGRLYSWEAVSTEVAGPERNSLVQLLRGRVRSMPGQ